MKITKNIKKIIEQNPLAFATARNKKPYVIGVLQLRLLMEIKLSLLIIL